jgi:glycosyltransferase involved in cell wall biosynthesis
MSPPRVAILFEHPTLNGGEHSMLSVLERLAGGQARVTALTPRTGDLVDAMRDARIPVVPLDLHDAAGRRLPRETSAENLLAALRNASPEIVHANSLAMGRLSGAVASRLSVPVLAHLRDIIKLSRSALDDLNRNRLLLAVSHATKSYHVAQGLCAGRIRVLYNGVDCSRFRPRGAAGRLRQELHLSKDDFLIAAIGQISLRKGQDVLAEAACLLAETLPNAHFLLVGERNSAKRESIEFERAVLRRFQEAGLAGRFHAIGYRRDVDRIMNEIDLLVHSAHQEPLGRVLLEAAASGVPIVATDVGGTREILTDGQSARLVPAADPQALARAISELHTDRQERNRFVAQARSSVLRNFNADQAAQNLLAVWTELVGS